MNRNFCLRQLFSERRTLDGGVVHFPGLRITFRHGKYRETVGHALVDTGADRTLLPLSMGIAMGFRFDLDRDKEMWDGAGGKQFAVFKSPEPIEHILEADGFPPYAWQANVHFTVEQPTILLGRKGCLENFVVTVDCRNKFTELRTHS